MSRPRLTARFKSDFNLKFDGSFLSLPGYSKMSSLAALLIIIFSRLAWLLFAADSIDLISSILSLMACASSAVVRGVPLVVADVRMRPPRKAELITLKPERESKRVITCLSYIFWLLLSSSICFVFRLSVMFNCVVFRLLAIKTMLPQLNEKYSLIGWEPGVNNHRQIVGEILKLKR